jgi:hypothetical protein
LAFLSLFPELGTDIHVKTFMSTDILKFANGEQNFQAKGLKTYLAISLPMMAITFLSWYGLYWLVTRGNNIRRRASGKRDEEDETYSYRV